MYNNLIGMGFRFWHGAGVLVGCIKDDDEVVMVYKYFNGKEGGWDYETMEEQYFLGSNPLVKKEMIWQV